MKLLFIILFILLLMFGSRMCNTSTNLPNIIIYHNKISENCDYVNINGASNCDGYAPNIQVHPYNGDFSSTHWNIYKSQIDSIVIINRNFWKDGLPSKKEIINNKYPAISGNDTIWIKIIDLTI